jgi:pantothenate kinase-related protein Tda10
MKLGPGEPLAGPWRVTPIHDLVRVLFDADRARDGQPWILAVDGRSGSGKSTVAALLHRTVPDGIAYLKIHIISHI